MENQRDYYEVLGVNRNDDIGTIKKAYRKLAMKFHPDRNPDNPEAEAKFKEASEAYSVLSDEQQRATYDRYGHAGLRGAGQQPGFSNTDEIFSHFSDLFGDLFGFGGGGRGRRRSAGGARAGADLQYRLGIEFLEAIGGTQKEIDVPRAVGCQPCQGSGAKPGSSAVTCETCGGVGEVIQAQMFLRIRTTCPTCSGKGKTIRTPCTTCRGSGRNRESVKLSVNVPPGVHSGQQLRLTGRGDEGDSGAPAGDLYVMLQVNEHEFFQREGDDIYCTIPISYPQACLGGKVPVPTVDGDEELEIGKGTPSGKVFTLRGKGAPRLGRDSRGDQHVQVVVDVPKKLSSEQEDLVRKLANLQNEPVGEKGFLREFWDRLTHTSANQAVD